MTYETEPHREESAENAAAFPANRFQTVEDDGAPVSARPADSEAMASIPLSALGWDVVFERSFAPLRTKGLSPARITREEKELYLVQGEEGEMTAEVSGRFRHAAQHQSDFPAVGDWVAIRYLPGEDRATIHALIPRKNRLSRKEAWQRTEEQVIAANVDTALIVAGLDQDFSPRRVERYLVLAWESGCRPVIVLSKADLCLDVLARVAEVETVALGVPIHAISAIAKLKGPGTRSGFEANPVMSPHGLDTIRPYLVPGTTIALLGSSGVGKSTLINVLLGDERQTVGAVRASDGRGRHVTTRRELIALPSGALLIDNPGMRELQLWGDEQGVDGTFGDIAGLAALCRFRDCRHQAEPGCAVRAALASGELDEDRFKCYFKMKRELHHLARRQGLLARQKERAGWKAVNRASEGRMKDEG